MNIRFYPLRLNSAFSIRSSTGVELRSPPWQFPADTPVRCLTIALYPPSDNASSGGLGHRDAEHQQWTNRRTHQWLAPGWKGGSSFQQIQKCLRAQLIRALSDVPLTHTSGCTIVTTPNWLRTVTLNFSDIKLELVMVIDWRTQCILATSVVRPGWGYSKRWGMQAFPAHEVDQAIRLDCLIANTLVYQPWSREKTQTISEMTR